VAAFRLCKPCWQAALVLTLHYFAPKKKINYMAGPYKELQSVSQITTNELRRDMIFFSHFLGCWGMQYQKNVYNKTNIIKSDLSKFVTRFVKLHKSPEMSRIE